MEKKLYQTLQDRHNPDHIEQEGPFQCKKRNSWLGVGYYYWDSFINNAHFWGETSYGVDKYVICEAECDYNTDKCLDLVGTTDHIASFNEFYAVLREQRLADENTTVARIIEYMKTKMVSFKYEAVRIYGVNSLGKNNIYSRRMKFVSDVSSAQYLDLLPAIQVCIFKKNGLNLKKFRIVHPTHYCNENEAI